MTHNLQLFYVFILALATLGTLNTYSEAHLGSKLWDTVHKPTKEPFRPYQAVGSISFFIYTSIYIHISVFIFIYKKQTPIQDLTYLLKSNQIFLKKYILPGLSEKCFLLKLLKQRGTHNFNQVLF